MDKKDTRLDMITIDSGTQQRPLDEDVLSRYPLLSEKAEMNWIRTTKRKRCPICEHPDWCSVSEDDTVVCCMRIESSKPCKSGGWFHNLREPVTYKPTPKKSKPVPIQDFTALSSQYVENLIHIDKLAEELGVSIRSLERLEAGWNGNVTFPMRDGRERIIGIRVRGSKGKWCVTGSRQGLFWPEGIYSGSDYSLVIAEGPTDVAALLTMGFDSIGRPNCMGGTEYIIEFLKGRRRDVIIMADKDPPKERPDGSVWFPGQEGADRLAKAIMPLVRSLKIVKPPFHKDVRAWLRDGATQETLLAVIENTRCVA